MKLSILICSIESRLSLFSELMRELTRQARCYPQKVEVLSLMDDCGLSVGTKRNRLVQCARGDYVIFVDDDDSVDCHYVDYLLKASSSSADALSITSMVYFNQNTPKLCHFSIKFNNEGEDQDHYWRWPNHCCAIRRELVMNHPFPDLRFGEDSAFARSIRNDLKTEVLVYSEPLYHYRFSSVHTTTQKSSS